MNRTLHFESIGGASGDMLLGALVGLGVPVEELNAELKSLQVDLFEIVVDEVVEQGMSGVRARVELHEHHHQHHHDLHRGHHHGRHLSTIVKLIGESALPDSVKHQASDVFQRIGKAEAAVHNVDIEKIHFHEVGAMDSIVDIVGAAIGLSYFKISALHASPVPLGRGQVETAHGWLPLPAPATLALLTDLPIYGTAQNVELVTPTGAAILATQVTRFGAIPSMVLNRIGYGAGSIDLPERPNLLRLMIGETEAHICEDRPRSLFSEDQPEMHAPFPAQHSHAGSYCSCR